MLEAATQAAAELGSKRIVFGTDAVIVTQSGDHSTLASNTVKASTVRALQDAARPHAIALSGVSHSSLQSDLATAGADDNVIPACCRALRPWTTWRR